MKLLYSALCAGIALSLHGTEPLLHYDFSGPVICKGGKIGAPEFVGNVEIDSESNCIRLQPDNYLAVPESSSISLLEGGTLYAVVQFEEDGRKDGMDNAHDMLFFKDKSFLLGRDRDNLYFNLGDGRSFQKGIYVSLPGCGWFAIAVTTAKSFHGDKTFYTSSIYINGERVKDITCQLQPEDNLEPVTFGRGWGGPWFMKGKVAEMRIYSIPLTPEECREISEGSLRKCGIKDKQK
ncbi:MAG: hypothetical protein J5944_11375 [Lentisphaeria bacterium]|nr:hypothetical protein [Lentisphaeria bacterium]